LPSEIKTKSTKLKSERKGNIKKKKEKKKEVDNVNAKILNRIIGSSTRENESGKGQLVDLQTLFSQRQDRLWKALEERYQYNSSVQRGQEFLLNHVNSKVELVIMYIDLVGSTKMSMTLPVEQLVTIMRAFSHEISSVVESHNGYVLKYVGDAIISFFPCGFNRYLISDNSVQCAKSMINVIKNGINPILTKHDYPELSVKVGIDEGENVVVQYGYDKSSLIDILGYSMNVAAKITSLTAANKISVGNAVYKLLHPTIQSKFELLSVDQGWKYVDRETGELYKVFTMR
jgi:class 3 adenylate cyclase